jgi:hypothetical protein
LSANLTPNIGPELGGTTVTITGEHFSQATQVKFGTTVATNLTVVSANSISVTTPAHAPGAVDVHIISPSGDRVLAGAFTYFEPISSVVDTEEEVLLLPEQQITPSFQFVAGDSQTISVPGFVPGEHVQLILASTPQLLASTTADAAGVATFTFMFPRDVEGFHTLAVFAPVSARGMRQAIFIHPVGTVIGLILIHVINRQSFHWSMELHMPWLQLLLHWQQQGLCSSSPEEEQSSESSGKTKNPLTNNPDAILRRH